MEEKSEEATKKKKKKINTSVFPELPVITTEHEYGSLGLGKEYLKPKIFGLDNSMSPCYNVTVDKLWIAFDSDENPLAREHRDCHSLVSGRHWVFLELIDQQTIARVSLL